MEEDIRIISDPISLQYYIPFYFDENRFEEVNGAFQSARQGKKECWEDVPFPVNDRDSLLYDHVKVMVNKKKSQYCVCRNWRYMVYDGNHYRLSDSQSGTIDFTISDMHAHLFKTGVGFLCYKLVMDPGSMRTSGQLIRFQSKIKRLGQKLCVLKPGEDGQEDREDSSNSKIPLNACFRDILLKTNPGIRFFESPDTKNEPQKAIAFSYLCYDTQDTESMKEITIHAATGYSRRNTQSRDSIDACRNLAGNTCFFVSPGGSAVSSGSITEENADFFLKRPPVQIYHLIYLIALYQHYSLLYFSMRLARDFPSDTQAYLKQADYAEKMLDYSTDLNTFLMKSDVATVSMENYHNKFYKACRSALSIEEDIRSIRNGFESLMQIQTGMQQSRQNERWREQQKQYWEDQDNQEKLGNRINVFAVILAVLAFLPELAGFVNRIWIWAKDGPGGLDRMDWLSMVFFVASVAVIIIVALFVYRKKRKSNRPDEKGNG